MFLSAGEGGNMPGSHHIRTLRDTLSRDVLDGLLADDGLVRELERPGSLLDLVDRVLPDLDRGEREWLGAIPPRLREAIRAVVQDVANDKERSTEIDVQFTPAYDFGLEMFEFDRTVVIRVAGPYPGQPYARDSFKSGG